MPIQEQSQRGDWDYELKKVYFVGILDFIMDEEKEEYWLYYLNNLADTIEIPPKLQNDEILTNAFRVAEFLALDKDAQWRYQQDLKRRLDYKAILECQRGSRAKRNGKKE